MRSADEPGRRNAQYKSAPTAEVIAQPKQLTDYS